MKILISKRGKGRKFKYIDIIVLTVKPVSVNARYGPKYHLTPAYRKAKTAIHLEAKSQFSFPVFMEEDIGIDIEMEQGRTDIDAYIKPLLDALQGVVYANDRQVKKLSVEIV
jgi:Holliday junction resolvase RusA-like endonuclease